MIIIKDKKYLTLTEASKMLGMHKHTFRIKYIATELIKGTKIGNAWYIPEDNIANFFETVTAMSADA